jgi:hypothetical protein
VEEGRKVGRRWKKREAFEGTRREGRKREPW